ncbi:FAD-binding protein [Slackia piriformis]|nr:FAD-binding protein [Slackia piriformis]
MTKIDLSRRTFLKGAGITALGAAAAGMLAGCGQGYQVSESEVPVNTRTAQNAGPAWLGEDPVVAESDITETVDTEVLVVGIGTGGIPASIAAAEAGAKTLAIERQSAIGNLREDIGAINSRYQIETEQTFPQFHIDKKEAIEDIVRYANGFVRYDLVKLWADESGACVDWLGDIIERNGNFKMWHEGSIGTENTGARDKAWATGHSPEKLTEDEAIEFGTELTSYGEEKGAEYRYNTEFVKLETNGDGRVTGIIARDTQDLHYIRINASKGVILATGGYGNNIEMMEDRQGWNQRLRIGVDGSGGNPTGDGIKACLRLGAKMDPTGCAVTFNRACVRPDTTADSDTVGRWFWFGEQPFLKVNLLGKRFCNESGPYDYMLHSTAMQPHSTYCDIWDANHAAHAEQMNEVGCCRLYPFDNGAPNNIPMAAVDGMIQGLIDDGYVQVADTPEELAEKLNIPVDTFVETFNHYNDMARAGEDTDYFKESYRMIPLDTPPYYGVRTGAWFLATIDGVIINTDMQPVNEDEEPIEGLYVVGNDSGGFFSVSYPNLFTGLACGRTMTFGRRAGMLAATSQA